MLDICALKSKARPSTRCCGEVHERGIGCIGYASHPSPYPRTPLLEWSRRCHRSLVDLPGLDILPSGFELLQILRYHASELILVKTTVTGPRAGYDTAALLLAISLSLRKRS